jgi:hypothetical protein
VSANRHDPTRRRFLAGSASALALGAVLPATSATATQMDRDLLDMLFAQEQALIDHYAALLEAFDEPAFRAAGLPDGTRPMIEAILAAEVVHQNVVTRPDGSHTTSSNVILPEDPVAALRQAAELENLTIAAYAFVIPDLGRQRLIPELLGILSVEGRHAAWLATLLGDDPFPEAIDPPLALEDEDPASDGTPASLEAAESPSTDAALESIVAAIADELSVATEEIGVVSATPETWPDASLGCPQPDMLYAQVVTPGFRVIVEVAGEQIEFHTDERANVVRCP